MKNGFIVMIYAFLLLGTNSETNSHNYDSYSAVSTNTNLSGQTVESSHLLQIKVLFILLTLELLLKIQL